VTVIVYKSVKIGRFDYIKFKFRLCIPYLFVIVATCIGQVDDILEMRKRLQQCFRSKSATTDMARL